ncbi:MAG: nucleotide exchange factor GrpE [Clostridia bacterium]|nr:nucleotide exchange factor GrpE [Clostridia bacterium]
MSEVEKVASKSEAVNEAEEKEAKAEEAEAEEKETTEEKVEQEKEPETHGESAKPEEAKPEEAKPEEAKPEEAKPEETEDLQDKYMRLMAEYQNFRNRTAKEKSDIYAHANEKFALDVLEVIDNFERAMSAKPEDDKFADGIELILKQLVSVLEKNNVKEIEALGKPFDPNFHNAVMTEAAGEGKEAETVTQVLQKGYILNSKVIRPAMVAVAKE